MEDQNDKDKRHPLLPSDGSKDRQRLYFVAEELADPKRRGCGATGERRGLHDEVSGTGTNITLPIEKRGPARLLADAELPERRPINGHGQDERNGDDGGRKEAHGEPRACGEVCELGDAEGRGRGERGDEAQPWSGGHTDGTDEPDVMVDTTQPGLEGHVRPIDMGLQGRTGEDGSVGEASASVGMGNSAGAGCKTWSGFSIGNEPRPAQPENPGPCNGFWRDAVWLPCRDGKARPTQPGIFPLAHGAPARVVRLRGYGDGLVAPQAEEFIRAYMEVLHD